MLFIKNWNKASLDKSSNSIVTRYKSKISSLTDKTDALRKLLGELYDEAVVLNERIKVDKQAIQEDLNDTAEDLRETCRNSSWGKDELDNAQELLDNAEEDIEDIKTDVEIVTGCLVVCQSSQGAGCGQPLPCDETFISTPEEEEECVVIVNGEFECTGSDSYIDNCYGGCFGNQSCDSQTKVCPKCHGSEVDVTETCTECDTDQKETCGTFDSQAGCEFNNDDGNCTIANETGDCSSCNDTGDCSSDNDAGDCHFNNKCGTCREKVTGNCGTENEAENIDGEKFDCEMFNKSDEDKCKHFNRGDSDCIKENAMGDCYKTNNRFTGNCTTENRSGDCVFLNKEGSCQYNDETQVCDTENVGQLTCARDDTDADYCIKENSETSDCNTENNYNDCGGFNKTGNCKAFNETGDCYGSNFSGNCTTNNVNEDGEAVGECATQSCEAGQECTVCVSDQKESTTTEKCEAGANIGEEEYCDTCQGDQSETEEWTQEELEDLCSSIFEGGADACGTVFASCFNVSECDGASFGAAAGCGTTQGCGTCNENDTCSGGQECATGQTCTNNDCGQDCGQPCGQCSSCYGGGDDCGQPCNETCYPSFGCSGGQECRLGYTPGCEEGVVCPGGTYNGDCGQWGGEDL